MHLLCAPALAGVTAFLGWREDSVADTAPAWLKANPYTNRTRCSKIEHERKAMQIANVAVYSILRDWIKGQVTAIECGILTFEGAFLGQILLPTGKTVLETVQDNQMLAIGGPK